MQKICRHDACPRTDIHPAHKISKRFARREARSMRRRAGAWKAGNRAVLTESIVAAVPLRTPTYFRPIVNAVRNDYGSADERTIYRGIATAVVTGQLVKMDVGLPFAVYMRPTSPFVRAPRELLHEMMLDQAEVKATSSNVRIASPTFVG